MYNNGIAINEGENGMHFLLPYVRKHWKLFCV
ncbi:MAG: hypothetical protein K0R28_4973, partial [Paenibacillus sp.]|nr:hypothetical protein [Paenibacillus sp.]